MGSSKKHKDKDREHKKKKKHRSRSKSPKDKKHKRDRRDKATDDHGEKRRKKESQYDYPAEYSDYPADMDPTALPSEYSSYQQPDQYGHGYDAYAYGEDGEIKTEVDHDQVAPVTYDYGHGQDPSGSGQYPAWSGSSGAGNEAIPGIGEAEPEADQGYKDQSSLSIEETNRLRAKLGLKPLDTGKVKTEDGKPTKKEDVHAPPVNLADVKKTKDIQEKLEAIKKKRMINKKLGKVKTLGESDSEEEDVLSWVKKSRKAAKEKQLAEKRAKMLEEMDEEFGIGNLVEEEFSSLKKPTGYSSKDLKGMRIKHGQDEFGEGKTVILTLEDKGVLDEDNEDVLMNYNLLDDAKARENIENRKKKPDYNPYDEEDENDIGEFRMKNILSKYDEEIDGKKKQFIELGAGGGYNAEYERMKKDYKSAMINKGETLSLPPPMIATEYLSQEEMASFKKVKKKVRKIRKKPKVTADMLLEMAEAKDTDLGSRHRRQRHDDYETDIPMELIEPGGDIPGLDLVDEDDNMETTEPETLTDAWKLGPEEDLTGVAVDDEAARDLEKALRKARKLKHKQKTEKQEHHVSQRVAEMGMDNGVDLVQRRPSKKKKVPTATLR